MFISIEFFVIRAAKAKPEEHQQGVRKQFLDE